MIIIIISSLFKVGVGDSFRLINANHSHAQLEAKLEKEMKTLLEIVSL